MSLHQNEMFLRQLDDPSAKAKIAEKFSGFIRDRLREESFNDAVIEPVNVDRSQCQISTNHEGLVKMEFIEPKSRASIMNFRGSPSVDFIRSERVEVPFFQIMTSLFQKPEQEFLVYPYPIAKVVETNAIRDMEEIQDFVAVGHYEACVQAMQLEANGGVVTSLNATAIQSNSVVERSVVKSSLARQSSTDDAVVHPLQREDVVALCNLIDGRRLRSAVILMPEVDFNQILNWSTLEWGDKHAEETTVRGYQHNTLLGKRIVRTIKTDILRPGNVYAFTEKEFLGVNYVLNNTKFYIDKVINIVKFCAWKDVAQAFVNVASVAKLELYSGDATSNDADGILASVSPVAEEDLGAENNRVAKDRTHFPKIDNW